MTFKERKGIVLHVCMLFPFKQEIPNFGKIFMYDKQPYSALILRVCVTATKKKKVFVSSTIPIWSLCDLFMQWRCHSCSERHERKKRVIAYHTLQLNIKRSRFPLWKKKRVHSRQKNTFLSNIFLLEYVVFYCASVSLSRFPNARKQAQNKLKKLFKPKWLIFHKCRQ